MRMEELLEPGAGIIIERLSKRNMAWEIRKILDGCEDLEEAKKRVDDLIEDMKDK